MIGSEPAWDDFISAHRWAVLTVLRRSGDPNSSVVAYARDDDELVVSTPGATLKRRLLEADPRVNLCVISNAEPFNFVSVEGSATVSVENLEEDTRRVFANLDGTGYREPADLEAWIRDQQRVILRVRPGRVYGVIR